MLAQTSDGRESECVVVVVAVAVAVVVPVVVAGVAACDAKGNG